MILARRHKSTRQADIAKVFLAIALFMVLQFPGLLLGRYFATADLKVAEHFCSDLAPKLEAWQKVHGSYPEKIGPLVENSSNLPLLLRAGNFYESNGSNYMFTVPDPRGLMSTRVYFSESKSWSSD